MSPKYLYFYLIRKLTLHYHPNHPATAEKQGGGSMKLWDCVSLAGTRKLVRTDLRWTWYLNTGRPVTITNVARR